MLYGRMPVRASLQLVVNACARDKRFAALQPEPRNPNESNHLSRTWRR